MVVRALKKARRKAECKWRKNKTANHYDLYKQSLCSFNYELCKSLRRQKAQRAEHHDGKSPEKRMQES